MKMLLNFQQPNKQETPNQYISGVTSREASRINGNFFLAFLWHTKPQLPQPGLSQNRMPLKGYEQRIISESSMATNSGEPNRFKR
jgi:hypothetical protein